MSANSTNSAGSFQVGPTDGNCLEAWSTPDAVENAHDLGNRDQYRAATNNNAQPLSPAPSANR